MRHFMALSFWHRLIRVCAWRINAGLLANQNPVLSPFDSPIGRHGVETAAWMPAISDELKV
jgi:hypothetical protein